MKKRTRRAKYENYYDELRKLGVLTEVKEQENNGIEKDKKTEDMTKKELIELLKRSGIEATEKLKKDELIELYRNNVENSNEEKVVNEGEKEDNIEVKEQENNGIEKDDSIEGIVETLDIDEEE
nr:MAG TPA: Thymopoietin protein [Caudoviricetes sp.]